MALNYAEQWSPELLEILMQGTLTSPFVTSNVRWVGARTFHFTQMSVSGFKNHKRTGGWNSGKYAQTDILHKKQLMAHRLWRKTVCKLQQCVQVSMKMEE